MKNSRWLSLMLTLALSAACFTGCGNGSSAASDAGSRSSIVSDVTETEEEQKAEVLEDGTYQVDFDTDSSMFHVNEACEGKGTMTVVDGVMTVHISLVSKKIQKLYPGLAEDAQKEGAEILEPTLDQVTYSDGFTEEVHGFDVPVPYLDQEFDLALVGEKGTWYDHKVSVSNPVKSQDAGENVPAKADASGDVISFSVEKETSLEELALSDGTYWVSVKLEGGSGKATVETPCELRVKDGMATAVLVWSSPYYDYMIVDGEEYQPVNTEGNSVFEIPVQTFGGPVDLQADTIAMSKPHLIDYSLTFAN